MVRPRPGGFDYDAETWALAVAEAQALAAAGVQGLVLRECIRLFFPDGSNSKPFPQLLPTDTWHLGGLAVRADSAILLIVGGLTIFGVHQLINRSKAVVIDVSESAEFSAGHVNGARNVPLGELESRLPAVVKNKALPVILVCASGVRARRAEIIAKKLGYEQAQVLGGGLKTWKEANLPLEKA